MKLLLLLGLVFFIYILQDVFHIKLGKTALPIEENKTETNVPMIGKTEHESLMNQIK